MRGALVEVGGYFVEDDETDAATGGRKLDAKQRARESEALTLAGGQ